MSSTCEMTMSDGGKGPFGYEQYWTCGRPAKAIIENRPGPGTKCVCGLHARAHDKTAKRYGFKLSEPIV